MSFGTQVKEELCRGEPARKCCARAEAYGVLLFCHTFAPREIKVVTGNAEDLGGPAVFLASEASDFVNGLILYVDGGILAYIGKQPG